MSENTAREKRKPTEEEETFLSDVFEKMVRHEAVSDEDEARARLVYDECCPTDDTFDRVVSMERERRNGLDKVDFGDVETQAAESLEEPAAATFATITTTQGDTFRSVDAFPVIEALREIYQTRPKVFAGLVRLVRAGALSGINETSVGWEILDTEGLLARGGAFSGVNETSVGWEALDAVGLIGDAGVNPLVAPLLRAAGVDVGNGDMLFQNPVKQ